ncbi:hypothetical protein Q4534_24035 [Cyclobacterium sp. 1_MG-2023]|uniref:hypothetical protein n=1 Tax=Cyclobacterium sp. 1_MG-2023 TaxID=3062681 RepID=UPI0026E2A002|nr:hypothetical protein [Cyclobacterium sp. 1_MG-2023]MDO6440512.1 hypothetical protein [Cyclobacterium sp. 1_MG-2023]
MPKSKLNKIDIERWRYILYETPDNKWIASFSYSPQSFIDLSMLIELTDDEKIKATSDRQFLINMADKVRNSYKGFLERALNRDNYEIPNSKNEKDN